MDQSKPKTQFADVLGICVLQLLYEAFNEMMKVDSHLLQMKTIYD